MVMDRFFPTASANVVCACEVAKKLVELGNIVDIIAIEENGDKLPEKYEGMNVYGVKTNLFYRAYYYSLKHPNRKIAQLVNKMLSILRKLIKLLFLHWSPFYSLAYPKRICKLAEKLNDKNSYDEIVTVYSPFENALGGLMFKKKHPECKWCIYALDSTIQSTPVGLDKKYRSTRYWLPIFAKYTDKFICMQSRCKEIDYYGIDWGDKLVVSDIPLLKESVVKNDETEDNNSEEIWIYAGACNAPYYNLDDLIDVFINAESKAENNRKLYIYSNGPDYERIKKRASKTEGKVVCPGYINRSLLNEMMKKADVLVSQKSCEQISSKVFEYMSYGKILVHVSSSDNDCTADYVKRYPRGIVIETYKNDYCECADILNESLCNMRKKRLKQIDLHSFFMNTPQYTCNLILESEI